MEDRYISVERGEQQGGLPPGILLPPPSLSGLAIAEAFSGQLLGKGQGPLYRCLASICRSPVSFPSFLPSFFADPRGGRAWIHGVTSREQRDTPLQATREIHSRLLLINDS